MPNVVSFIQYAQPGLDDGTYSLTATQTIGATGDHPIAPTSYGSASRFAVVGPRFSLPASDVVSVFPPPFSLGEFSNVIPHVVLARNTLPWERSLGADSKVNDLPWLGVVVLAESDHPPSPCSATLLDLLPTNEQTEDGQWGLRPLDCYFPPFPKKPNTQYPDLDYGESWSSPCVVLDLPAALFNRLLPTVEDLGWLSHVREIELKCKSETYIRKLRFAAADPDPIGQVAEVVGNRLPPPGEKCVSHLVSLEKFASVLPGKDGGSNLPPGITSVRLVSLKSWTFSSLLQTYTFAGSLLKVDQSGGAFTGATLQVPFQATGTAGDAAVANAFKMGLTAFNHTTRLGDKTVSWFHGPLVPFNIAMPVLFPGNVADQFTRYNPDSGMFDVSYSVAWQLGRLLGLQASSYSSALYEWKRATTLAVIQSVEEQFLNLPYGEMLSLLKESFANYLMAPPPGVGAQSPGADAHTRGLSPQPPAVHAPSRVVRPGRESAIREALRDVDSIRRLLPEDNIPALPSAVYNFLGRLRLLYGLPFNYLVPDERMLPSESLRFFYLDSAWVDSLLEGALSLGNATSGDATITRATAPFVHAKVHASARAIRRDVLKLRAEDNPSITPIANPTGFLLRSQVVTGWPGMEVHGYDAGDTELAILRLEQVGPGVLLGIFDGVVHKLVLNEHPEALHFGVDENVYDPSPSKFTKSFRYVTVVGTNQPGAPVPLATAAPLVVPEYTRPGESSILRMDDFAAAMKAELGATNVYSGSFTSAEFALEMIEGVGRVTYTFGAKPASRT